ncbi:MAG: guanylate kinase [Haliscomenobacter sp.]|nr:guanylate kinase [Haliscomenobacter sp.]MBK7475164.1 guanylate kinase [Haliscomenobacter sp.]MBK8879705.1 guanylate kinase [Haliscomenobacter sp.]
MRKLIILTAPSGAGKTTIVRRLLEVFENLAFSISATTRPRRPHEEDGKDYYFMDVAEFEQNIRQGNFLEWEEVYPGKYYGTLKREVERLWAEGKDIIFDIDVRGAMNIKQAFPEQAMAIFVKPPSKEALVERLTKRQTESGKTLEERIAKAEEELLFENKFGRVIVNDELSVALANAENLVRTWLDS